MENVRRILSRLTTRQKVIGGAVVLYVLILAGIGFALTIDLQISLVTIALTTAALVFMSRIGLEWWKERKAGEYLVQTSAFVFSFLDKYKQPPVPVQPLFDSEEVRRTAEVSFNKAVAIVKIRLLLRNANLEDSSGTKRANMQHWLTQYATTYGKATNRPGSGGLPYFYPVGVEVSGLNLQISIVIADNGAAVRYIKNPPQPAPPDTEQYKDDDFL